MMATLNPGAGFSGVMTGLPTILLLKARLVQVQQVEYKATANWIGQVRVRRLRLQALEVLARSEHHLILSHHYPPRLRSHCTRQWLERLLQRMFDGGTWFDAGVSPLSADL